MHAGACWRASQKQRTRKLPPAAVPSAPAEMFEEAKRTGQRSWGEEHGRTLGDLWNELPQAERQRYEAESQLRK